MALEGLLLRVTHTGKAADSVHISDISDGVDVLASFRKPGAIYVPTPEKGGASILVYSGDVAVSHASGGICKFVQQGYLTAEFVAGTEFAVLLPSILDEGVLLTTKPTSIDFVGPGVTATAVGDIVTVTIAGGGSSTHPGLPVAGLIWSGSGHTGDINTLAGFNGSGAAIYISKTVTGDVTGTFPGPLTVTDLTISGETHGDVIFFDGTNWIRLAPSTAGYVLSTNGVGVDPAWIAGGSGTLNHALLTSNLAWLTSGHTGAAGSLAAYTAGGAASLVTGTTHGDTLYFNGVDWSRLAPGSTTNNPLVTQTAGSPPAWSSTIAVDTITESTTSNGVLTNGIRNYGKLAVDPVVGPAPLDGDSYYNTTLRMSMQYDGTRAKWLTVDSTKFDFGRSNNVPAGVYFRGGDRQVMSATEGWLAERDGTVVAFGYTRQDFDVVVFDVVESGVSIGTISSTASSGRDILINADFSANSILSVRSAPASANTMTKVIGWIRVKWRT